MIDKITQMPYNVVYKRWYYIMDKTINSDLMRGNINTIILKSLYNGDRYGYDIIREIKEKSHGQYILKQPTLYSCLKRLENQGFIRGCWGEESNGGRRKYYTLTDLGREVFIKSQDEYEYSRTIIDQLISERDYDLDSIERSIDDDDEPFDDTDPLIEKDYNTISAPQAQNSARNTEIATQSKTRDSEIVTTTTPIGEIIEQNQTTSIDFDALLAQTTANYTVNIETETITPPLASTKESTIYEFSEQQEETITDITTNTEEQSPITTAYKQQHDDTVATTSTTASFISYHSPDNIQSTYQQSKPKNQDSSQSTSTTYRSTLSDLIEGFNNPKPQESEIEHSQQTKINEIKSQGSLSVKEKIQVKNFGRLTESIRKMGETVKIRTANPDAIKKYNNQYYYYKNKLSLYQNAILFVVMLLETFLSFVIIKRGFNINNPHDTTFYIISVLFCLAFPVYSALSYLSNPTAKKRLEYNFKASLILRIIIALQLCLITYALCVFFNMPIAGQAEYALYLAIPILLSTNIPLSTIIFRFLYKSKNFAV